MNKKRGAKRGRLSAQGDISFHATFDRHAHREATDGKAGEEMIHVGEIVFAKLDGTSSSMRKLKARPGGPTISVCAALPKSNDDQTTFPSNHKYVGVTKTKLDARRSPKEQRFVVQCGGLATIRLPIVEEGGERTYCVGDLLLCQQPDKSMHDDRSCCGVGKIVIWRFALSDRRSLPRKWQERGHYGCDTQRECTGHLLSPLVADRGR